MPTADDKFNIFTPGRWNKKAGSTPSPSSAWTVESAAHYVTGPFTPSQGMAVACGLFIHGFWDEWKVHVDIGQVPLCEGCKAQVHK